MQIGGQKQQISAAGLPQTQRKKTRLMVQYERLRKTSKSRFDGVERYLSEKYRSKNLPIPSWNETVDTTQAHQFSKMKLIENGAFTVKDDLSVKQQQKLGTATQFMQKTTGSSSSKFTSGMMQQVQQPSHHNQSNPNNMSPLTRKQSAGGKSIKSAAQIRIQTLSNKQKTLNLRKTTSEMRELLKQKITESKDQVERVKRGHSIFETDLIPNASKKTAATDEGQADTAADQSSRVILARPNIKPAVEYYLDLTVAETTYQSQTMNPKHTESIVELIRRSPLKKVQRKMEKAQKELVRRTVNSSQLQKQTQMLENNSSSYSQNNQLNAHQNLQSKEAGTTNHNMSANQRRSQVGQQHYGGIKRQKIDVVEEPNTANSLGRMTNSLEDAPSSPYLLNSHILPRKFTNLVQRGGNRSSFNINSNDVPARSISFQIEKDRNQKMGVPNDFLLATTIEENQTPRQPQPQPQQPTRGSSFSQRRTATNNYLPLNNSSTDDLYQTPLRLANKTKQQASNKSNHLWPSRVNQIQNSAGKNQSSLSTIQQTRFSAYEDMMKNNQQVPSVSSLQHQTLLPKAKLKNSLKNIVEQRLDALNIVRAASVLQENRRSANFKWSPVKKSSKNLNQLQQAKNGRFAENNENLSAEKDQSLRDGLNEGWVSYTGGHWLQEAPLSDRHSDFDGTSFYGGTASQPAILLQSALKQPSTRFGKTASQSALSNNNRTASQNDPNTALLGNQQTASFSKEMDKFTNTNLPQNISKSTSFHKSQTGGEKIGQQNQIQQQIVASGQGQGYNKYEQNINEDSDEEKNLPFLGNVETELNKEFGEYEDMFDIPINPAFFNSTNIRQPKKLKSLKQFLKEEGIAATVSQHRLYQRERIRIKHRFWKHGIDMVIPGYLESTFTQKLLNFMEELDLSKMTSKERALIFSKPMCMDPISRRIQNFITKFSTEWEMWLYQQSQLYIERLGERLRQKHGEVKWKELLRDGNLTFEMAKRQPFYEHIKRVKKCVKHGTRTAEAQEICLLCQAVEAFKTGKIDDPANVKGFSANEGEGPDQYNENIDLVSDNNSEDKGIFTNERQLLSASNINELEINKNLVEDGLEHNNTKLLSLTKNGPFVPKTSKIETLEEQLIREKREKVATELSAQTSKLVIFQMSDVLAQGEINNLDELTKMFKKDKSILKKAKSDIQQQFIQNNPEQISRLLMEGETRQTVELNALVNQLSSMVKAQKGYEKEQLVAAQNMGLKVTAGDFSHESASDKRKREEFQAKFKELLGRVFDIRGRKMLVDRYNKWFEGVEMHLGHLDQQVYELTKGDLRKARRRDGKVKFNPHRQNLASLDDTEKQEEYDSADEEARQQAKLMKKCFSRKNQALGKMIRTTEQFQDKNRKFMGDLEKLLIRCKMDRPNIIQEKFKIIWANDEDPILNRADDDGHQSSTGVDGVVGRSNIRSQSVLVQENGLNSNEKVDTLEFSASMNKHLSGTNQQLQQQSNNRDTSQPNKKQTKKKQLLNTRDIIRDRQSRRLKDNLHQKDGYQRMMLFLLQRRSQNEKFDVQAEEIRFSNGIKKVIESGWTVDPPTLQYLLEIAGIQQVIDEARDVDDGKPMNPRVIHICQFAFKFCSNLGLPNFFELITSCHPKRDEFDKEFCLDPSLYFETKQSAIKQMKKTPITNTHKPTTTTTNE